VALPDALIQQRDLAPGAVTQSKQRQRVVRVTFPTADAPTVFSHTLGRTPVGYTVAKLGKGNGTTYINPGTIYNDQPLPCDSRHIVLKCSVAGASGEILVR
jgi:hypothetical protein